MVIINLEKNDTETSTYSEFRINIKLPCHRHMDSLIKSIIISFEISVFLEMVPTQFFFHWFAELFCQYTCFVSVLIFVVFALWHFRFKI